jgi:hypothetical protein
VFAAAQLDIKIEDRFGNPSVPREWFLVPFEAIKEAINRLKDRSLTNYAYDPEVESLRLGDQFNWRAIFLVQVGGYERKQQGLGFTATYEMPPGWFSQKTA